MMGARIGVAVQLLVLGLAAGVLASPLQQADDPAAMQALFPDLVQTVKEMVNADKGKAAGRDYLGSVWCKSVDACRRV